MKPVFEGKNVYIEYDTIMDFLDSVIVDPSQMVIKNVEACFWENPLHDRHFDTMRELYLHCDAITK